MYRQGDILLVESGAPELSKGEFWTVIETGIVAKGELTGHAHRFDSGATVFVRDSTWRREAVKSGGRPPEDMYVHVHEETATIRHDEHGPITLPKGYYRVVHQREFDGEQIRYVSD